MNGRQSDDNQKLLVFVRADICIILSDYLRKSYPVGCFKKAY